MTYRGILHAHSTHSYDGKLSLSELKAVLKTQGVAFACMTEHTDQMTPEGARLYVEECRALSDETFVFVPGFEVPYGKAHVLHIGAEDFVCQEATTKVELAAWRQVAPLVVLAHPVRNAFVVDGALLSVLDGIEIWNQQYEGKGAPRTKSVALLNALRRQKPLLATGGIDLHRVEHLGSPYITLEIDTLSEREIVSALSAGQCSFGSARHNIKATEVWQPSLVTQLESYVSCAVISVGKAVNRTLAARGIRLPKGLVRSIRGRV
jgi:predicted metal-dependent phosphoesterase TrpH